MRYRAFRQLNRCLITAVVIFAAIALVASASLATSNVSTKISVDRVFPVFNPQPKDLPPVPIPEDNKQTPVKVKLGEKLFFDPKLSVDGTVSCSSCHDPKFGFSDGEQVSDGVGGQTGGRNSPSVYNAAYFVLQFWDGRAATLEDQARGPVVNPIEMANTWDNVTAYLKSDRTYQRLFMQAFDGVITEDTAVMAIAAYERTVITWNSPYDRYVAGDKNAMTPDQIAGMDLFFGKAMCGDCHAPPLFLEEAFGNIGVPDAGFEHIHFPNSDMPPELQNHDLGLYYTTGDPADIGVFKTPGLRNVELTAPYMHNGIYSTLAEVVAHYNDVPDPVVGTLEPDLERQLNLNETEQMQLVEFLKALTGIVYTYGSMNNDLSFTTAFASEILVRQS